jgi:hypothetical protein
MSAAKSLTIKLSSLRGLLRSEAESYRVIAFPKGGAKTITTRDQQNHALVARGSYAAIRRLLERFK